MSETSAVPVKVLYTAEATATGGRAGHAASSDGRLNVDLSVPAEIGGDAGPGTNPEQLFAAGYAACFQGAMGVVARRDNMSIEGSTVTARVGLGPMGQAFGITVELRVHLPEIADRAAAEDLEERPESLPVGSWQQRRGLGRARQRPAAALGLPEGGCWLGE